MKIENGVLIEVEESDFQKEEVKRTFLDKLTGKKYDAKNVLIIPEGVSQISEDAFKNIKGKLNKVIAIKSKTFFFLIEIAVKNNIIGLFSFKIFLVNLVQSHTNHIMIVMRFFE